MGRTMTNFEVLMSCESPEQFLRVFDHFGMGCMQWMKNTDSIKLHKEHCILPEYRGFDGCYRCKIDFWNAEYIEAGE